MRKRESMQLEGDHDRWDLEGVRRKVEMMSCFIVSMYGIPKGKIVQIFKNCNKKTKIK